jgi:hypothetical protein
MRALRAITLVRHSIARYSHSWCPDHAPPLCRCRPHRKCAITGAAQGVHQDAERTMSMQHSPARVHARTRSRRVTARETRALNLRVALQPTRSPPLGHGLISVSLLHCRRHHHQFHFFVAVTSAYSLTGPGGCCTTSMLPLTQLSRALRYSFRDIQFFRLHYFFKWATWAGGCCTTSSR